MAPSLAVECRFSSLFSQQVDLFHYYWKAFQCDRGSRKQILKTEKREASSIHITAFTSDHSHCHLGDNTYTQKKICGTGCALIAIDREIEKLMIVTDLICAQAGTRLRPRGTLWPA